MDRRTMLGILGTGATGMMALNVGEARADQGHDHHDKTMEDCIKACADCAKVCDEMFRHCFMLVEKGQKDHAQSAKLSLDCAAFCGMSLCMMNRHSPMMDLACQGCADACKRCGDECAKHESEEMKKCAEACRQCEKACRAMVAAHKAHHAGA